MTDTATNATIDTVVKARHSTPTIDPSWVAENIDYSGNYATLNIALTAIGSSVKTLVINKAVTINDNTVIPATLGLRIENGGSIGLAGKTLTINGPFSAGGYQVFSGTGTVTFGNQAEVHPEWWGANTTPGKKSGSIALTANALANTHTRTSDEIGS